ncbi:MAG: pyridoxamine 5'-phosphate oxidase family protein [Marinosulfonomonas sp.]|nr:pyridoxamine 5'-phosphate oxidase family protein [Marinosulfonomonas sp.]
MEYVDTIEALEAIYGQPSEAAIIKVAHHLTPMYRTWIMRSRFCILSTVGPDGTDGSPRGDAGSVVVELDQQTLALPDWRGNNRMDTLRNIIADERIALMFMVAGSTTVMRVNGRAKVTTDAGMLARFEVTGKHPRSVIIIKIAEIYSQCARAVMRAGLWSDGDLSEGLPTVGDMLKEMTGGTFDGESYDRAWGAQAKETMW